MMPSEPRTDRPYIVCDTCGHLWTVWNEPTDCGTCGGKTLWTFPTVPAAVTHSHTIRNRTEVHTIPVPRGWSVEQAWEAISRGDKLDDRDPEPSWANVLVRDGKLVVRQDKT